MRSWSFYLGIIGCIFGYVLVFAAIYLIFLMPDNKIIIPNIFITGLFSVIGLVGTLYEKKKLISGGLLVIAGSGIALTYMPYSFIPTFFFLPAGLINILNELK